MKERVKGDFYTYATIRILSVDPNISIEKYENVMFGWIRHLIWLDTVMLELCSPG